MVDCVELGVKPGEATGKNLDVKRVLSNRFSIIAHVARLVRREILRGAKISRQACLTWRQSVLGRGHQSCSLDSLACPARCSGHQIGIPLAWAILDPRHVWFSRHTGEVSRHPD